jgi:hypothetical protein
MLSLEMMQSLGMMLTRMFWMITHTLIRGSHGQRYIIILKNGHILLWRHLTDTGLLFTRLLCYGECIYNVLFVVTCWYEERGITCSKKTLEWQASGNCKCLLNSNMVLWHSST